MLPVIVNRKIRIGVVGCGRISKNHFDSIKKHADNIELMAVCDIDSRVLTKHTSECSVSGYLDFERMLAAEQLDLVALCASKCRISCVFNPDHRRDGC
jgi:UDP-N-acetyl-2-amino-2-deoxyglucuronate dehydrogenase